MGSNPKVSIIIPVYNVEQYLENCLKSIIHQTLQDIEIICVNDGSTDNSLSILNKLSQYDNRIKIINQRNAGAGAARNKGISVANGEYIGFVDSDDIIAPEMYEFFYNKAIEVNADMVIMGEIETFVGDNIRFPLIEFEEQSKIMSLDSFIAIEYPEILQNVFFFFLIYSKKFWIDNHFQIPEERKFAEDVLICTQTSVLANRIGYIKGPYYWYRNQREDSLSYRLSKTSQKNDFIRAISETKKFLKSTDKYDYFARDFLTFSFHLFALLQRKITEYQSYKQFVSAMYDVLDFNDINIILSTWLKNDYFKLINNLKEKHYINCYLKNMIFRLLNLY